jgi:hypothetical protein
MEYRSKSEAHKDITADTKFKYDPRNTQSVNKVHKKGDRQL